MAAILYKWSIIVLAVFVPVRNGEGQTPVFSSAEAAVWSSKMVHPFYVSVTEINYNKASRSLEIAFKAFTDDLETALKKKFQTPTDLLSLKDRELASRRLAEYIMSRLGIRINDKPVSLKFLGFEQEREAIWSYLEAEPAPEPGKIEIVNSILYDSFDQQIHLVHVMVDGKRKSAKLAYPADRLQLDF